MLTRLDDYPLHQTPEPIAHPATGDRNFYDRYFFHGYSRDGDLMFGAALGLYPNRRVMDAAVSVVADGVQHTVRASRLAPRERTETRVGPIVVEVVEPLRTLRVRVEPNATGIEGELLFEACTEALEEPRMTTRAGGRVVLDATRLTQFGAWSGRLRWAGRERVLDRRAVPGTRDRSWGIRPVGEPEGGAPAPLPAQFFWVWAPLHFERHCILAAVAEDAAGRPWFESGWRLTTGAFGEDSMHELRRVGHRLRWQPGTRRAAGGTLVLETVGGEVLEIDLEPLLVFPMRGLGYLGSDWGHGSYKGEDVTDGQTWELAREDPLSHLHVQQVVRARAGGETGIGVLEQLVIGPHAPSGFRDLLDPARD
ncbi:MAG TPA: hypothetical protein VNO26_12835 [Candidatus Limnocylindria bacterium]|nr:hypothetical protein [Candidatus Limnocylindria bacterium]